MKQSVSLLRRLFTVLTAIIVLAVLLLIFQFTDVAFSVWGRLQELSVGFLWVYCVGVIFIAALGMILIYKIWTLGRARSPQSLTKKQRSLAEIQQRLQKAQAQGIDTTDIEYELAQLQADTPNVFLEIAFFGKISTGKSSLIQTLLPQANIEISIIGGTTATIDRYHYQTANGVHLTLLDMPGTHQAETLAQLDETVLQAARKAHIVCYVLDQDMTASDWESITQLHHFHKPMIVVLNKINRYSEQEQMQLKNRIQSRLPKDTPLVLTASAYPQHVKFMRQDGSEECIERVGGGDVQALLHAITDLEKQRGYLVNSQRQAIMALADDALNMRIGQQRKKKGEALVKSYARKAMLGGVAAVGPGTDVIIQGYLGMEMVKALCKLYDVPAKHIDLQTLIESATGKVRTQMTVLLALAGNVCKAFPGIGTVIGGASHALAYGLIFESLGNAVVQTLDQHAEAFNDQNIIKHFEEQLQHDLEKRAVSLLKSTFNDKTEY